MSIDERSPAELYKTKKMDGHCSSTNLAAKIRRTNGSWNSLSECDDMTIDVFSSEIAEKNLTHLVGKVQMRACLIT